MAIFLPSSVRGVDGRFHLVERECLESSDILIAAGGPEHLHDVGTRGDLSPHGAKNLGHSVGLAAPRNDEPGLCLLGRDLQPVAGDEHSRAEHGAAIDQIAHGDIGVVGCAQVAYGGDPGFERLAGVFLRQEDRHGGHPSLGLGPWTRAGASVPVIRHMRMRVDETRDAGVAGQVDRFGAWRRGDVARAHAQDPVILHDDDGVFEHRAGTGHQFSEPDHLRFGFGEARARRQRYGENDRQDGSVKLGAHSFASKHLRG